LSEALKCEAKSSNNWNLQGKDFAAVKNDSRWAKRDELEIRQTAKSGKLKYDAKILRKRSCTFPPDSFDFSLINGAER